MNGNLYNVVPRAGEPARFGIVLDPSPIPGNPVVFPKIILQSAAQLRPSDLGLDTILNDLPEHSDDRPMTDRRSTSTPSR